jgi:hypothetical protein
MSDTLPPSVTRNLSSKGVQFIINNGATALVATAQPRLGTQYLTGPGIGHGCINLTAGASCNGSTALGAWYILTSGPVGPNTIVDFHGAIISPRPGPAANGQGPNLLLNGSMAHDACGLGATDGCGGAATAAGGALSGWTTSGGQNPACNSGGPGTLGGDYVPQSFTLSGNAALGAAIMAGGLAITCGYTASDPAGNAAFWIDVEGYAAAGSAFNLYQSIPVPSQRYLATTSDKVRGYVQYAITAGLKARSDGAHHIYGANAPEVAVTETVPAGTVYGRPCNAKSGPGSNCTFSSAACQPNVSNNPGNVLIDAALIDGATWPYLMEKCLTPPAPLFGDAGGGTASSLTWRLVFPFEVNVPMSYCLYIEDAEAHVAAY